MSQGVYNYFRKLAENGEKHVPLIEAAEDLTTSVQILRYSEAQLEDEKRVLLSECERLNATLSCLTDERDGLHAKLACLMDERNGLMDERNGLIEERNGLNSSLDGLNSRLTGIEAERNLLQTQLEAARQQAASLQIRLDAILVSTSWRIMAPLRFVLIRSPGLQRLIRSSLKLVRPLIRSALKPVRWAVTLQLPRLSRKWKALSVTADSVSNPSKTVQAAEVELQAVLQSIDAELNLSKPSVTVVIPCFNYGRFVSEAVESVLNQSYPHVDVIVVDDGSTDPMTKEVVDRLATYRVCVHKQTNQGLAAARNAGAGLSNSEFLLFLDADDRLHPHALSLMLWLLIKNPDTSYVYTSQRFFGDDNLIWEPQIYNGYDLLWSNHPSVCSLIRRDAFYSVGGYSSGMVVGYEDWNHWIMLLDAGHFGLRLRAPLFEHRRHGHTMTHDAHLRRHLLHRKIRSHSPSLYTMSKITELKRRWRPAVSVIMPFYNSERFIGETLESLQAQTISDFELIIVDDGSDSVSARKCLEEIEVSAKNSSFPIRVIRCEHKGLPAARNTGVLESRAEYIYFLDSDDLLSPTALEKLTLFAACNPDKAFVYSAIRHFGLVNGIASDPYDPQRLMRSNFLAASCLIRRSAYLQAGGMDEALVDNYEDYDFWLRMLEEDLTGMLLPEVLFHYRRHKTGNSAALEGRSSIDEMYARLRARHPKLYGGIEPDRSGWKLLETPLQNPAQEQLEKLTTEVYGATVRRDSYRYACTPNLFDPARWEKTKPSVLYLLPFFVCGGAEQVDLDILKGFKERGFDVTIVASQNATHVWLDRFSAVSDDIYILPNLSSDLSVQDRILNYLMVSRAIDVVFIRNTQSGYRLAEQWRDVSDQVRFVDLLHLHADGEDWVRHSAIYHDLLARRFVITNDLKDYACKTYKLDSDKFQVIYNGVDLQEISDPEQHRLLKLAVCAELGLDHDRPIIAFCGRLADQKDPLRWIRVMKEVITSRPETQGLVIGDGDLLEQTKSEAGRLGISGQIVFCGYRSDARRLLGGCDVLLMTSRHEGLPQVVLEALASGVPVVCSDVGGTRECVDGTVGSLLDLLSPDSAYGSAVIERLDCVRDQPEIRYACRNRVKTLFDVERQRAEYSQCIETLAKQTDRQVRFDAYMDFLMSKPVLN